MLQLIRKSLISLYVQYELVTCISMFEPWEKKLINSIVALILSLVIFSSFVYLPTYIQTFLHFVSPIPLPSNDSPNYILQTEKISITSFRFVVISYKYMNLMLLMFKFTNLNCCIQNNGSFDDYHLRALIVTKIEVKHKIYLNIILFKNSIIT
uniref:Serine palmitoyltransferase small subunit B n=1 Tax=Glossina brevipalpis TaxID=37001 RepID=A0A1A9W7C3_9MUSC